MASRQACPGGIGRAKDRPEQARRLALPEKSTSWPHSRIVFQVPPPLRPIPSEELVLSLRTDNSAGPVTSGAMHGKKGGTGWPDYEPDCCC
jgi:hypothetical protein